MKSFKFKLLVFLQFGAIFFILATGPVILDSQKLSIIEIAGAFLGVWAVYTMRIGNFNISPVIKKNGVMRAKGPYSVIRHPMYLAILLTLIPMLINYFSYARLGVIFFLAALLVYKMNLEEKLLLSHFKNYQPYLQKTKRLIPLIY